MRWQGTLHTQGSSESPHWRGATPPARLLHRLPSLNRVVPQQPPPSNRLRGAGRNVAVCPDGGPLRVHRRRVGLEVTELLLLLGIQPPVTTSLFWRLVEAAVLVGHMDGLTTCCHPSSNDNDPCHCARTLTRLPLSTSCAMYRKSSRSPCIGSEQQKEPMRRI